MTKNEHQSIIICFYSGKTGIDLVILYYEVHGFFFNQQFAFED